MEDLTLSRRLLQTILRKYSFVIDVKCENKVFRIYEFLLGAYSPVLYNMFYAGLTESRSNSLTICNFNHKTVELFINYMQEPPYPLYEMDNFFDYDWDLLADIYRISHQYQVDSLLKESLNLLLGKMKLENAPVARRMSEIYDLPMVKARAWDIIRECCPVDLCVKEPIENKILIQIETYFNDAFFIEFLAPDTDKDEGWLPIETLLKFTGLESILNDQLEDSRIAKIAESLLSSSIVDVHEFGLKVRRDTAVPFLEVDSNTRTVYLKGFPSSVQQNALLDHFKKFEGVDAIFMRYYKEKTIVVVDGIKKLEASNENSNTRAAESVEKDKETTAKKLEIPNSTKVVWERKFKGSIFVVFDTEENAKKLIAEENTSYCDVPLLKMLQKEYTEKKEARYKESIKEQKEREHDIGDEAIPLGVFLKMSNIPENITHQMIKKNWYDELDKKKYQISFMDFELGETEGILCLKIENSASEALEQLWDKKFPINGSQSINVELLSPEVEEKYRGKIIQERLQRKRHHDNGTDDQPTKFVKITIYTSPTLHNLDDW